MNIHIQHTFLRLALLPLFLFGFTACDSDDDGGGTPVDAAGSWRGSGAYDQGTKINDFQLNLSQDGNAVSGTYSVSRTARPTMTGSVNGTVSGGKIDINMTPHGYADGSINGNSMSLY